MARPKNEALREFVLRQIPEHGGNIAPFVAQQMHVSRALVSGYLRELISEGLVIAEGNTKARTYKLKILDEVTFPLDLTSGPQEDMVWRQHFFPRFSTLPKNILEICEYGFGEIVNNAIDHSEGSKCLIAMRRDYASVSIFISDNGVGIFEKIARECMLANKHEAILELSKGKLTTDKTKHTGEGIFFTSRMMDEFAILSGGLGFYRQRQWDGEMPVDVQENEPRMGTGVQLVISTAAQQTTQGVFAKYLDDEFRFSKTTIPLKLARYEGENLVSRSQAKRIMSRVERFRDVLLDFAEIATVGQQFADEIFRVWAKAHPEVSLTPTNCSDDVHRMIAHAQANLSEDKS